MTHRDSGVVATGQSNKSRQSNIREAFRSTAKSKEFKLWLKMETAERILNGSSIREKVRRMMGEETLKIEVIRT